MCLLSIVALSYDLVSDTTEVVGVGIVQWTGLERQDRGLSSIEMWLTAEPS